MLSIWTGLKFCLLIKNNLLPDDEIVALSKWKALNFADENLMWLNPLPDNKF